MALINFQPNPKIPPIGFFEPISVDPKDMMTDVEYLLGILKKLNQVIAQVNKNSEFIENYSGKIEELEAEIGDLKVEIDDFKTEVNETINTRFAQMKVELQALVAAVLNQAVAYTDSEVERLEAEIREISVGQIMLYDPTTGILSPLQTVIDNIYGMTREDALTATEYDALDLTATDYDGYLLSAFEYDNHGKSLLV